LGRFLLKSDNGEYFQEINFNIGFNEGGFFVCCLGLFYSFYTLPACCGEQKE
jgi:hypothetical protein